MDADETPILQMKTIFLLVHALCLAALCAAQAADAAPPVERPWTRGGVVGLNIELIDPVRYERIGFAAEGHAIMTIGQKKGWITAPVFYWKLVSGRLRITTDGTKLYDEFTLLARNTSEITVRRQDGTIAKFNVLPR